MNPFQEDGNSIVYAASEAFRNNSNWGRALWPSQYTLTMSNLHWQDSGMLLKYSRATNATSRLL